MCSNYLPPTPEQLRYFNLGDPDFRYGECYPGSTGPFLCNQQPDSWTPGVFGLIPHWAEPVLARRTYNARSETVAKLPSFRNAWRKRQFCIIPAAAIYEPNWETGKAVRWRIERADGAPMGIAGIWEQKGEMWSYSMLTINAGEHPVMHHFHRPDDEKRSVVILAPADFEKWLGATSEEDARGLLQQFDPALVRTMPEPRPRRGVRTEIMK